LQVIGGTGIHLLCPVLKFVVGLLSGHGMHFEPLPPSD
jgi:hypothetical protein